MALMQQRSLPPSFLHPSSLPSKLYLLLTTGSHPDPHCSSHDQHTPGIQTSHERRFCVCARVRVCVGELKTPYASCVYINHLMCQTAPLFTVHRSKMNKRQGAFLPRLNTLLARTHTDTHAHPCIETYTATHIHIQRQKGDRGRWRDIIQRWIGG